MTSATLNLQAWYNSPSAQGDLAKLLAEGPLHDAMLILRGTAQATEFATNDLATIALRHAALAGFTKALNELEALAQPPKATPKKLPEPWSHIKPKNHDQ